MSKRLFLPAMLLAACAFAADPDPGPSLGEYARGLVTVRRLVGVAVSVGVNTGLNSPGEWGRTWAGTGKRFASSYGGAEVKYTFAYAIAAAHHEDLEYRPSNLHGMKARGWYAIKRTFIVPRRNGSGSEVAYGPIAGNLAAGMVSRLWLPDSERTVHQGLMSAGVGISADVGWNLLNEFFWRGKRR